ncbi:hypothetical protein IL306_012546 [Fusarium sp. DS 682]|nr:hypothetical protein IL306_012546 [Fusarium sp. DS 682]
MSRVAKELPKNEAASTLGELNFEPLIQRMELDIQVARDKLKVLQPESSKKDRWNFVRCRSEIEAVIAKVSQTGMFLNITLVNLLMQVILKEPSSNSLREVLKASDIQSKLYVTIEAVKGAVKDLVNRPIEQEVQNPENFIDKEVHMEEVSRPDSIKSAKSGSILSVRQRFHLTGKIQRTVDQGLASAKRAAQTFSKRPRLETRPDSDGSKISSEPANISPLRISSTPVDPGNAEDGSSFQVVQFHLTEKNESSPESEGTKDPSSMMAGESNLVTNNDDTNTSYDEVALESRGVLQNPTPESDMDPLTSKDTSDLGPQTYSKAVQKTIGQDQQMNSALQQTSLFRTLRATSILPS